MKAIAIRACGTNHARALTENCDNEAGRQGRAHWIVVFEARNIEVLIFLRVLLQLQAVSMVHLSST